MIEVYTSLSKNIADVLKSAEENKEGFNLFYAITKDKSHHEKYHSNFISYLLNPNESHGFGERFSVLFFETIESEEFIKMKIKDVKTEDNINGKGRPDIVIKFENGKSIFLENKIRAVENGRQIFDYLNYFNDSVENSDLLILGYFLTKNGEMPISVKPGSPLFKKFKCISYREHVIAWLDKCILKTCDFVHVRSAIKQYKNIIDQELGNTSKSNAMKPIKEELFGNLDDLYLIIKHRNEVYETITEIISESKRKFIETLIKSTKEELSSMEGVSDLEINGHFVKYTHKGIRLQIFMDYDSEKEDGLYWSINDLDGKPLKGMESLKFKYYQGVKVNGNNAYDGKKEELSQVLEDIIRCSKEDIFMKSIVSESSRDIVSEFKNKVLGH
jgi:PD-(D/E)XK nuclease superfamily